METRQGLQGLKPLSSLASIAARLKSCPCYKTDLGKRDLERPASGCLLPRARFSRNLKAMEVLFTAEIEAKLARSATQQGRNPGELVQQVVARYFDEESRFIDAVNRARTRCCTASTSRTSKWASALNGS